MVVFFIELIFPVLWKLRYYLPWFGVLALAFVVLKSVWVSKQDKGNKKMNKISKHIANGAMSFLKTEHKILLIFVFGIAILWYFKGIYDIGSRAMVAVAFIVGAVCLVLVGLEWKPQLKLT